MHSYDSAKDIVIYYQPVDVEHCASIFRAAMQLSQTAFEETMVNILPALNDTELANLQSKIPLSSWIPSSPKRLFANIVKVVSGGQMEAERTWFQMWHTYSLSSGIWWNLACSTLTGDDSFRVRLVATMSDISDCIDSAFRGSNLPTGLDLIKHVAVHGRKRSGAHRTEDEMLIEMNALQKHALGSDSASTLNIVTSLFAYTNKYLRKLVRLERQKFPESSIFPSPGARPSESFVSRGFLP